MKYRDLVASSALGLLVLSSTSSSVFAQEPAGVPKSQDNEAEETIIVTARKRPEALQRTPAAVAVLTSKEIEARGITNIQALAFQTPGVVATSAGAEFQAVVRGIGPASLAAGIDAPVGFIIDGVDTSRFLSMVGLIDIQQIEVMPGPQGTLYGGAAAGGVINISTRNPGKELGADGFLEVGNYGATHLRVGADIPIFDRLQLRAVYDRDYHDGYLSNGLQDREQQTGRVTIAFQPSDVFSGNIKVTYSDLGGRGTAVPTALPIDPSDPWRVSDDPNLAFFDSGMGLAGMTVGQLDQYSQAVLGRPIAFPSEFSRFTSGYSTDQQIFMISGRFDLELGGLTLSYLPGYQDLDRRVVAPVSNDGLFNLFTGDPLPATHLRYSQFNERQVHELRLSNESGSKLEWLVGGYYSHDEVDNGIFYGVLYNAITLEPVETDSYAAFGQATYSLTPDLRLTAGLRYNHDEKEMTSVGGAGLLPTAAIVAAFCPQAPPAALAGCVTGGGFDLLPDYYLAPSAVVHSSHKWNSVNYKAGIEYDVTDDNLVYGTIQSGYLRGGLNYSGDILDPVKLTSFVVGSKNTFFDGRMRLNLEAFYYDYRDLQVIYTTASGATQGYNVPKSRVYGAEITTNIQLGPDTVGSAGVNLLSATYRNFDLSSAVGFPANLSGLRLASAPTISANIGLEHTFHLGNYRLVASTQHHFESGTWRTFDHGMISITSNGMYKKGYWIGDASLTLMPESGRWSLGGYVRNIGDEDAGAAVLSGFVNVVERNVPRTYGMRLTFDY